MFDLIKKTMFASLGLAFLTKEKIEELSRDFAEKGRLSEEEGRRFFEELSMRSEDAKAEVRGHIQKAVKDILRRMNLATRDDHLNLEKQVKQLRKAIKDKQASG
jgi:polyhydroxyalkanoate synthesis regulator phasin